MKFGRFYSMLIEGRDGTIQNGQAHQIDFPLTCRFSVINDNTFTLGSATFQIFNLSKDVRNDLYKDQFEILTYKQVIFSAGYLGDPTIPVVIFKGNVVQCFSYRQGPDWITEIIAADGAWSQSNSTIDLTIKDGYTLKYAIQKLVNSMSPRVQQGLIGNLVTSTVANTRGLTFSGSPFDLLVRQCIPRQLQAYIYQEKCYVMTQGEYINASGLVLDISGDTGMLGSPRLQGYQVMVDMIFEPKLVVQQKIHLTTEDNRMSGDYIVWRVSHRGTISGAVCEDLRSQVTLARPASGNLTPALDSAVAGVLV